ncbi:MAG: hypothetical protein WC256_03045 [Desulfurivibrionaceae bacterium]|jgi:hypothetical protein
MKKYAFHISIIIILLLASSVNAQSLPLWNGAEYGMTIEQVQSIFPNAERLLKSNIHHTGTDEHLTLEDVYFLSEHFKADFYFNRGKLTQIALSLKEHRDVNSVMTAFNSLTEALRAKHGTEINLQIRKGILNYAKATWLNGYTNIGLSVIGDKNAVLYITYQVGIAHEANRLRS